ncbi:hypothetical protein HZC21_00770 [Candidatus Peregrinibacteria bacterium]|nr:hypothetical protein [Candidatus Peregrinibacteria bacterium]
MTLKLIPTEEAGKNDFRQNGKRQKHFNPGDKLNRERAGKDGSLKHICLKLVHFINRGSRFTYQQIDELIMGMQKSILSLQKKKQEAIKRKLKGQNSKFKT